MHTYIKHTYFDSVLSNIKNDRNLAYAVSLDALHKWKDKSQEIVLEFLKKQTTLSTSKLEGITDALIEFSNYSLMDRNLLAQLRVKVDSRIYDDTDGSNLAWVKNVFTLFRSQTQLDFHLKWIITSLLGNPTIPISALYVEPLLDLLKYFIDNEKLDNDTKFDVIICANQIKLELLHTDDYDDLVDLRITVLRILRKGLPISLYPRFIFLKIRYFIRSVLDFGSLYDILALVAVIAAPFGTLFFQDNTIFPAIVACIGLVILFAIKFRSAQRKRRK